jgi:chemotaxis family two-component system response regulator Rcp1
VQRIYEVLLIDDNPGDARLMHEGWMECKTAQTRVHILHEPGAAIPFLKRTAPDLILLDYTMPTNGGAALAAIKAHPEFQKIPAVVVTGSASPVDILDIYQRGANCCMAKPHDLDGYLELIQRIADYWLCSVTLPPRSGNAQA